MGPSFARSEITADSIRQDREREVQRERETSLQNLSLHRVPELSAGERDAVLQQQAGKKQELARHVIGNIRPDEVTARVREETQGKATTTLKFTDAVSPATAREEIGAAARQVTREIGREHGLAAYETERMATEVAELAAGIAAGRAATEESLRISQEADHAIAGVVVEGADGKLTRAGAERLSHGPEQRGGKGLDLTGYSPRGRVVRVAA